MIGKLLVGKVNLVTLNGGNLNLVLGKLLAILCLLLEGSEGYVDGSTLGLNLPENLNLAVGSLVYVIGRGGLARLVVVGLAKSLNYGLACRGGAVGNLDIRVNLNYGLCLANLSGKESAERTVGIGSNLDNLVIGGLIDGSNFLCCIGLIEKLELSLVAYDDGIAKLNLLALLAVCRVEVVLCVLTNECCRNSVCKLLSVVKARKVNEIGGLNLVKVGADVRGSVHILKVEYVAVRVGCIIAEEYDILRAYSTALKLVGVELLSVSKELLCKGIVNLIVDVVLTLTLGSAELTVLNLDFAKRLNKLIVINRYVAREVLLGEIVRAAARKRKHEHYDDKNSRNNSLFHICFLCLP